MCFEVVGCKRGCIGVSMCFLYVCWSREGVFHPNPIKRNNKNIQKPYSYLKTNYPKESEAFSKFANDETVSRRFCWAKWTFVCHGLCRTWKIFQALWVPVRVSFG